MGNNNAADGRALMGLIFIDIHSLLIASIYIFNRITRLKGAFDILDEAVMNCFFISGDFFSLHSGPQFVH